MSLCTYTYIHESASTLIKVTLHKRRWMLAAAAAVAAVQLNSHSRSLYSFHPASNNFPVSFQRHYLHVYILYINVYGIKSRDTTYPGVTFLIEFWLGLGLMAGETSATSGKIEENDKLFSRLVSSTFRKIKFSSQLF